MIDADLADAFERTWPAAGHVDLGGFRVGRGEGAGGRVSSARVIGVWTPADIEAASAQHLRWGQRPLFRAADEDKALIAALEAAGFRRETPTAIMAAPVGVLTDQPLPPVTAFALWPPMAIQREIWSAGNVTAARQAVMERAEGVKTAILGRMQDRAVGAAFVAVLGPVAMVHAVEVDPALRRRGMAGWMMRQAAIWAEAQGAARIGLAVSRANVAARALYDRLGFAEAGGYAYYAR